VAFSLGMETSFPPWERAISQDRWQLTYWLIIKKSKIKIVL